MPPAWAVTDPAVHGAPVAGTQGCGVSTPWAAVVAAATCGLPRLMHRPKGEMLVSGMVSRSETRSRGVSWGLLRDR